MEGILSGLELMEQALWKYFKYTKRISCECLALFFAVQNVVRRSERCSPFKTLFAVQIETQFRKFCRNMKI